MASGTRIVKASPFETADKLRMMLAAANCEITHASDSELDFQHGTYLTQTAPLFLKRAKIRLDPSRAGTSLNYDIHVAKPIVIWLSIFSILFCWLIFPPLIAYRALVYHPRRFMENLLAGL